MPEPTVTIPEEIPPVEPLQQFDQPQLGFALTQAARLIRAQEARDVFRVDGAGLTVAVLDSGLNTRHVDFAGRIAPGRNFTADNGGDPDDVTDGHSHGTNVAGIIMADGDHLGIAPGARVAPLKVLTNAGGGSFRQVAQALQWVIDHHEEHRISVACLSLSDQRNHPSDRQLADTEIGPRIAELRRRDVAVVVASGNEYFRHDSKPGMGFPAIHRHAVSVGAVYDDFEGPFQYGSGAKAFSSAPDCITPFSQRLHDDEEQDCRTDLFAPGAPVTSAGIQGRHGESIQHGTSQAAPVVAGVILLMQHLHLRETGKLLPVDDVVMLLRQSARPILDGDDERDNVKHRDQEFLRVDAFAAVQAVGKFLQKQLLLTGTPLKR